MSLCHSATSHEDDDIGVGGFLLSEHFRERLGLLCKGLTSYMKAEQEMFVILGKCQKEVTR